MNTTQIAETFDERATSYDDWARQRTEPLPEPARSLLRRIATVEAELFRQLGRVAYTGIDVVGRLGRVAWSGAREAATAGADLASGSRKDISQRGTATKEEVARVANMVRTAGRTGADRVAEEIEAAGEMIAHARQEPTTDYESWTREELYDRAQALGIDGRSSMSKDQLIDALRAA